MRRRPILFALLVLILGWASALHAEWSPERAARYLDERQKQWFAWKPAASPSGPCVSCHTGMTYLLARPALRRVLKEPEPTIYERGLLDRLRANVGAKPPGALQDVEVVFAAMFLAGQDVTGTMSAHTQKAFEQLWTLQHQEGPINGAWKWYAANLDPWENPGSGYFGASLAAMALGATPADYQNGEGVRNHVALLSAYLSRSNAQATLHDRLALLWASSKRPAVLSRAMRTELLADVFSKQQPDGGWSIESLGPWMVHPDAVQSTGSHAYATSFAAYVLGQEGTAQSHPGLGRALEWLRSHQDAKTGAWPAVSMNKRYPADSMESLFMQDAATAFASLALTHAGR